MIVVDTSALMAVIMDEPEAGKCREALSDADGIIISAGTLMEALIVARNRALGDELEALLDKFEVRTVPVSEAAARRAAIAYDLWGKGRHPAKLNLADCFAFDLAQSERLPLLYVGNDFARTDIESALA